MIAILEPIKTIALFITALYLISCGGLSEYDSEQVELALGDSLLNSTESWGFSMNIIEAGVLRMNMNGA